MVSPRFAVIALVALATAGCDPAGRPVKSPVEHDEPVPASVKRAELRLVLALPASRDCEEAFDLALYEDRGVDLIQWDDEEGCDGRVVVVRYLPDRIDEATLRARIRELATQVSAPSPKDAP